MNDSSAPEHTLPEEQDTSNSVNLQQFRSSPWHRVVTLVGLTLVLFDVAFIDLYSHNFWFSLNIESLGIPTALVLALLAHALLICLESRYACQWLRFIWKGAPPIIYLKWLQVDESGITFGIRHLRWEVIDELTLTWLGNLHIKSRALCGERASEPDILLKLPFGIGSPQDQKLLVETIQRLRPSVRINTRLSKRLTTPILPGQSFVQSLGLLIITLGVLDATNSLFHSLEMLKHYYLSHKFAADGGPQALENASRELKIADELRDHPFPVSYVTPQILNRGIMAAGTLYLRSDALMAMNRQPEAIIAARKIVEIMPHDFRANLHLARQLMESGQVAESRRQIQEAIDNHKDSLLPRLYLIASLRDDGAGAAANEYKTTLSHLDGHVFGERPVWPPGGDRYAAATFFQPDLHFVFDRLLNADALDARTTIHPSDKEKQ